MKIGSIILFALMICSNVILNSQDNKIHDMNVAFLSSLAFADTECSVDCPDGSSVSTIDTCHACSAKNSCVKCYDSNWNIIEEKCCDTTTA